MLNQFRPAIVLLALFSLLTDLFYPLAVTGIAQVIAPDRANGSLVPIAGAPAGSVLIGQNFASDKYFHGRPSATRAQDPAHPEDSSKTVDAPYNAANSAGSNLGPTSQKLSDRVKASADALRAAGLARARPRPGAARHRQRARDAIAVRIVAQTLGGGGQERNSAGRNRLRAQGAWGALRRHVAAGGRRIRPAGGLAADRRVESGRDRGGALGVREGGAGGVEDRTLPNSRFQFRRRSRGQCRETDNWPGDGHSCGDRKSTRLNSSHRH